MSASMDELYRDMQHFRDDLVGFNEMLKSSIHDLEGEYDQVSGLWQDEFRRMFDRQWGPFRETMNHYVVSEGPGYVEFLSMKLQQLGRYLGNG